MSKEKVVDRLANIVKHDLGVPLTEINVLNQARLAGYWYDCTFWVRARTLGVPAGNNKSYILTSRDGSYIWKERHELRNGEEC